MDEKDIAGFWFMVGLQTFHKVNTYKGGKEYFNTYYNEFNETLNSIETIEELDNILKKKDNNND